MHTETGSLKTKCNPCVIKEIEGEVIRPKPVIWFEFDGRITFGNRSVEEKWLKYRHKMGERERCYIRLQKVNG